MINKPSDRNSFFIKEVQVIQDGEKSSAFVILKVNRCGEVTCSRLSDISGNPIKIPEGASVVSVTGDKFFKVDNSIAARTSVYPAISGEVKFEMIRDQVSITISGAGAYDGVYSVASSDMVDPVNIIPPSVTGEGSLGSVLTKVGGLWAYDSSNGAPTVTYQWQRDGSDISGANGTTYTLVAADQGTSVTVVETAADADGSRSATSNGVAVPAAPVTTITSTGGGTLEVNTTETEVALTVSGTARYDGTYTVAIADLVDPFNLVAPSVSGNTGVGDNLDLYPGLWAYDSSNGAPTVTYQWQRDGSDISGANGTTYTLVAADQGTSVTVVETAADADGSRSATSNGVAVPAAPSTTTYTDNFDSYANGTNVTDLATYTKLDGTNRATVQNGEIAVRAGVGASEFFRRVENVGVNQFIEVLVVNTPDNSNRLILNVRQTGADSYYLFCSDGVTRVRKNVGGVTTTYSNDAVGAVQAGDRLRLSVAGGEITVTRTRGGVATVKTYTDATPLASGQPSMGFQNYGPTTAVALVTELTVGEL